MDFSVMSMVAILITTFSLVRVILSPTATRVSALLGFVMFCSNFTICDMAPESAITDLLSCSWFDVSTINGVWYIMSSVMLFADYFFAFSSCSNPFIHDYSFFNHCISSCYLHSCCSLTFLSWLYSDSLS